jgi:hypothetical protein
VEQAIVPLIEECKREIHAEMSSVAIAELRRQAEALATTPGESKIIRQRLHLPTMDLRAGRLLVEVEQLAFLEELEQELARLRCVTTIHQS